jgi:hypothetical protein
VLEPGLFGFWRTGVEYDEAYVANAIYGATTASATARNEFRELSAAMPPVWVVPGDVGSAAVATARPSACIS